MLHHFGGFVGFFTHVSFLPEKGIGVVVLANESGFGGQFALSASLSIYDILFDDPGLEERLERRIEQARAGLDANREAYTADFENRAARPQDLPHPPEAYTGTFENDMLGTMTMSLVDGKLELTWGELWSTTEVYDAEKNAIRIAPFGSGGVLNYHFPENSQPASGFEHMRQEFVRVK